MFCENCGKEIANDSKFCEFCRAKIENFSKTLIRESVIMEPDRDFKNLKSKPWYRFLKILYVIVFCISILFAFVRIPFVEKAFRNKDIIINCKGDYAFQNNKASFKLINTANAGIATYRDALFLNRIKLEEIEKNNQINNQIKELCSGKKYYININLHVDKFLVLITTLLSIIIIFEIIKQISYYIFIGKMHHSWLIVKLIKIWK